MKKNKLSIISTSFFLSIFVLSMTFHSCQGYLDIDEYIYDRTTIDSVFDSRIKLMEYVNGILPFLPAEGSPHRGASTPAGQASDEWFASWEDGAQAGMYLLLDNITPEHWAFDGLWGDMYKGIRKSNIVLSRINECTELSDMERRDYTGRAHFLRAYFYFTLLRHYGPVPILPDKAFDADTPAEVVMQERNTWDECADYIRLDFEKAAELLPLVRELAFEFAPTSGAALALRARLLLHQASAWYNGNTRYGNWVRTDGEPFILQQNDPIRWGKAAVAFKEVMNLNLYKIHTVSRESHTLPLPKTVSAAAFPDGAGDIDPYLSYKDIFDGTIFSSQNSELIYYVQVSNNESMILGTPISLSGINGFNIPLAMIEQYRWADGRQYSEGTEEERSWESIGNRITFSGNYVIGANVAKRDVNREPRFYASIGYNHCIWPGTSYTENSSLTNYEVTYYKDGTGAAGSFPADYNHTGYTCRKFIHQEDHLRAGNLNTKKVMPIVRYAEILLGYVEAMNEMEGSYTDVKNPDPMATDDDITVSHDVDEMVRCFNQIRYRAGLPGITTADASDKERMRQLIEQERQIEFAFESHRYHDLRRWGIAQQRIDTRMMGYNVGARTSEREKFYTPIILDKEKIYRRTFNQKMYFYPIPRKVMDKNFKLVQNPGWR